MTVIRADGISYIIDPDTGLHQLELHRDGWDVEVTWGVEDEPAGAWIARHDDAEHPLLDAEAA